jgi:hypothetical protein
MGCGGHDDVAHVAGAAAVVAPPTITTNLHISTVIGNSQPTIPTQHFALRHLVADLMHLYLGYMKRLFMI